MSRTIAMLIALTAVTTSSAGICSVTTEHVAKRASAAHVSRVSVQKHSGNTSERKHPEVIALAPAEAEVGGWRTKVAAAGPTSQVTQDEALREPEPEGNLNIYGMLIAALGLGGMSIVRRMGGL